jgi:hypothetical protein
MPASPNAANPSALPIVDRAPGAVRVRIVPGGELRESVEASASPEAEQAWAAVIARRSREVLDGTGATRDLDAGLDAIEARARAAALSPGRARRLVTTR